MSQMYAYKTALFSFWEIKFDHIYCFLSTHTLLTVSAAILDLWRKRLLYGYFEINFTLYVYFHVMEIHCNPIRLFFSTLASLPVLAAILIFFLFQSFFDRKLLSRCINDLYFCSQEVKIYQIGSFLWKISSFAKNAYLASILYFLIPCFYQKLMT